MLVLVNPFSGPGKALHIFQQQVIPIFAEAGLLYQLFVTGVFRVHCSLKIHLKWLTEYVLVKI